MTPPAKRPGLRPAGPVPIPDTTPLGVAGGFRRGMSADPDGFKDEDAAIAK
jgi:hypothetical protein